MKPSLRQPAAAEDESELVLQSSELALDSGTAGYNCFHCSGPCEIVVTGAILPLRRGDRGNAALATLVVDPVVVASGGDVRHLHAILMRRLEMPR